MAKSTYYERVFHTSVSWWFLTALLMTAILLKSLGTLLSILADLNNTVIWMVSTRPLISKSSCPPVPLSILWWLYRAHQLQLVSLSFIIIIPCEFFTPFSADFLLLESERQQVSSGLQDYSKNMAAPNNGLRFFLQFPTVPVTFSIFWGQFQLVS